MNGYRQALNNMEIRPDRSNEAQFLPGSGCIDTAIWMHYMDANQTAGEET